MPLESFAKVAPGARRGGKLLKIAGASRRLSKAAKGEERRRAQAALDLAGIVPEELIDRVTASGVDFEELLVRIKESGIAPQEILNLDSGSKHYRVWLD